MMAFEKKERKGIGEKSRFSFFILILDKNQKRVGKNKPHLTSLVHHGHVARKNKTHTHTTWVLCYKCAIQSTYLHVFPFTPPLSNPVTPYPLLLCWQTALISSELLIDASYLGEKRVCPQQVNMRLPHPPSRQTHMTLFDTLSQIALWHAGRIKGGIFHVQLEWKIKAMKCGVQRKAGDQKTVMKGD